MTVSPRLFAAVLSSGLLTLLVPGDATAGPEMAAANAGPGMAVAASPAPVMLSPSGVPVGAAAGNMYHEYYAYGAYVRRSYVPGYIPKTSSLFENPREYMSALCVMGNEYRYANMRGWFYGSPNGYQSSVPPNSQAHAYMTGQLGITSSLQYGYPRGQRVIEPVIIPFAAHQERAGLYITSDGVYPAAAAPASVQPAVSQTVQRTVETTVERPALPVPPEK